MNESMKERISIKRKSRCKQSNIKDIAIGVASMVTWERCAETMMTVVQRFPSSRVSFHRNAPWGK